MERSVIRKHIVFSAVVLYLILYTFIIGMRPHFLYNKDGSLRDFGLGFKKKTIVPVWLLAILLGIVSYYIILFSLSTRYLLF